MSCRAGCSSGLWWLCRRAATFAPAWLFFIFVKRGGHRAAVGATVLGMRRETNHCSVCGSAGHNRQLHDDDALTRSEQAGRLVYDEGISFAEAGRRIGITRQAAYQGWRRYVHRRDLHQQGSANILDV